MPVWQNRFALWLGAGVLTCGTALALQNVDPTLAGWSPVVTLWGGDVDQSLATLDRVTHALDAAIHKYEIDKPTQKFINGMLKELEDFDLDGLYALLPDERAGGRELNVKGALAGDRYLVGRAEPNSPYFVSMKGPRTELADMSLFVHAEKKDADDHDSLRVRGSAGLGLGPLSFRALADAQRELLRMVTTGTPVAGGAPLPVGGLAQAAVREFNPGLGEEDLRALALLFDSYPTVGRALIDLGRVEDVRTAEQGSYYHITTRLRAEPERIQKKYPALAKHLQRLSDVLQADARVLDDKGRDLVRGVVNTKTMQVSLQFYVRDGLILPFDGARVYEDEPVDPLAGMLQHARVMVNARVNMLGIEVTAKALRVDADLEVHDTYASASARVNTAPKLKVQGHALGVFSPGFLDLFIPSNMQDITEEFFRVIAEGNGGEGAVGTGELGAASAGAAGAISGSGSLEIMDTFLVKLAGGLVADRLVINDKEKDEVIRLAGDLHDAFVADLGTFKKRMGR